MNVHFFQGVLLLLIFLKISVVEKWLPPPSLAMNNESRGNYLMLFFNLNLHTHINFFHISLTLKDSLIIGPIQPAFTAYY